MAPRYVHVAHRHIARPAENRDAVGDGRASARRDGAGGDIRAGLAGRAPRQRLAILEGSGDGFDGEVVVRLCRRAAGDVADDEAVARAIGQRVAVADRPPDGVQPHVIAVAVDEANDRGRPPGAIVHAGSVSEGPGDTGRRGREFIGPGKGRMVVADENRRRAACAPGDRLACRSRSPGEEAAGRRVVQPVPPVNDFVRLVGDIERGTVEVDVVDAKPAVGADRAPEKQFDHVPPIGVVRPEVERGAARAP